jgi:hypothetical protein
MAAGLVAPPFRASAPMMEDGQVLLPNGNAQISQWKRRL